MANLKRTVIAKNAVECADCGSTIESLHPTHTVTCSCGAITISGGKEQLIRIGDINAVIDKSIKSVESSDDEFFGDDDCDDS